ncbi:MAG: hypothetical protein HQL88_06950 [Magnetococcales bacterium]|nr:hypothetical protein [Magnetococcales bacterium]
MWWLSIFLFTRLPEQATMTLSVGVVGMIVRKMGETMAREAGNATMTGLSAAAAIQAALAAESQAVQAVAACRQQAEEILDEARRQASAIAAQADQRISDLHKACNKRIRKQEEAAQATAHRHRPVGEKSPTELLHLPVARLAAWLTGDRQAMPTPSPSNGPSP